MNQYWSPDDEIGADRKLRPTAFNRRPSRDKQGSEVQFVAILRTRFSEVFREPSHKENPALIKLDA